MDIPRPMLRMHALLLSFTLGTPALAADLYAVDPVHTRVAFRVMHAGLSPSIGTVSQPTGTVLYDESDPSASQVSIDVNVASLDMGDADWSRKVLEDFLDSRQHPTARFRSTSVEKTAEHQLRVSGDLHIAGGSTPVTFDVILHALKRHPLTLKKTLGLEASTAFSRKALGIDDWASLVGDRVHLDIALEANLVDRDRGKDNP